MMWWLSAADSYLGRRAANAVLQAAGAPFGVVVDIHKYFQDRRGDGKDGDDHLGAVVLHGS